MMKRRWIFRVHLWLALLAGGFFVLLGLTGCVIAFESPLDHLFHPRLSFVPSSPRNLPLADILLSVRKSYPEQDIIAIDFSNSPTLAWQVTIPAGIVCVNPHTAQVLGLRTRGETILGLAHDLHVSLAAGDIGRTTIRWCDLAALVLLVSGLSLWWPQRRFRLHRLDRTRRSWSDLHNVIGVLSLIFLFVAAGTGALISFENPLRSVLRRFTAPAPAPPAALPPTPQNQPFLSPDRALAIASAALPGTHPAQMTMPEYGGTYRLSMIERHRFGDDLERSVSLDPWSGTVLQISSTGAPSIADHLVATNEALHTGALFGWPGRVLMALASFALLPQALTGLIMFWKRSGQSREHGRHRLEKGTLA